MRALFYGTRTRFTSEPRVISSAGDAKRLAHGETGNMAWLAVLNSKAETTSHRSEQTRLRPLPGYRAPFEADGFPCAREFAGREALRSDASKSAFIISGGIDSWFSHELNALLRVDLDGLGLSKNAPYALFRHPWGNLLTLRFEKMRTCAREALSEMFGFPAENLKSLNTFNEHVSKDFRDEFIKRLSVTDELKENIYSTRYARYFYQNT